MNCVIIMFIMLQSEIFDSQGYIKFVTQSDGSMDLLVQLADLKSKSMAYIFNNNKIRKILSIQRKKESINGTIDRLKNKIVRWRQFTRTTLKDEKLELMMQSQSDAYSKMPETKDLQDDIKTKLAMGIAGLSKKKSVDSDHESEDSDKVRDEPTPVTSPTKQVKF